MTIDEMKKKKKELGYSYETIAKRSGLPLSTVQKILGGITKAPREASLKALEKALSDSDHVPDQNPHTGNYSATRYRDASLECAPADSSEALGDPVNMVSESSAAYHSGYTPLERAGADGRRFLSSAAIEEIHYMRKLTHDPKQGNYTAADRDRLPEDRRTELIDGVLYDMASPSPRHQVILGKLHQMIQNQIDKEGCNCLAVIAPLDISPDGDPYTRVQPDLFVTCHPLGASSSNCLIGAPDFIVEVLSPSTRRKDQKVKSRKYAEGGVKEYWMIDPDAETITVLYLNGEDREDGIFAAIYGFGDRIPIGICKDGFEVDFSRISKSVKRAQDNHLIPSPDNLVFVKNRKTAPSFQNEPDGPDEPA